MKKIYVLVTLLYSFQIFFSQAFASDNAPILKKHAISQVELIPKGWKLLEYAIGDMNKDGNDDFIFVIQDTNMDNIKPNDGLGRAYIDLNPRILAIYFGNNNNGYEKYIQKNNFIPLQDSSVMDEPFDGIEITKNGILKIKFRFWVSAGSWTTSTHTYIFKFNKKNLYLIGYDSYEAHRASGDTVEYSMNFLAQKMSVEKGNFSQNNPDSVIWKNFKLDKLKTLQDISKLFEWEFMGLNL